MHFCSCSLSEDVPPPSAINKGHLGNQKSKCHSSNYLIKNTTDSKPISINNFTGMFVCIGKDNIILHLHCTLMVVLENGPVVKQPLISRAVERRKIFSTLAEKYLPSGDSSTWPGSWLCWGHTMLPGSLHQPAGLALLAAHHYHLSALRCAGPKWVARSQACTGCTSQAGPGSRAVHQELT